MDVEMASWKSTGTYVDEVPSPGANIVSAMWIFRVKRPPCSSPVFKARYIARGFSQRQGVDFFQTFSPTPKMTTLRAPREWHDTLRMTLAALGFAPSTADPSLFLRTDTTLPPFYVLVYVDDLVFATAHTEALAHVKSELQKRHTCTDLGELTSYLGLRITRDRAPHTITLTQSHMVQQVLQRFDFTYSSPQSTPLPTGHSLSHPPSDESVELSGPYPELVGCLISSCEAEIYVGAMAAQELRWLTYLLTDLGEAPRSPPVLYVDNKAMLALCQEHRLEHRTKHIAPRYFLARELQQRGQLHLAYVATRANTADIFTKALQPCDHLHFCTMLGCVHCLVFPLYITLHVNWPCGHLLVLRMCGDVVIHHELALPFLTGLVSYLYPPVCLFSHSFLHYSDTGTKGDTSMLRVRGFMGQYRPTSATIGKFTSRARWGIHLGISYEYKGWLILDLDFNKIAPARDVLFDERLTLARYLKDRKVGAARAYAKNGRSFASPEDEGAATALDCDPSDEHPGVPPRPRDDDDDDDDDDNDDDNAPEPSRR
ncbi:unnamed protein product [Closterium sp. NIES-54]